MAKRSFNKKARSLQPAVMKINYRVPANQTGVFCDISNDTGKLNRRFMRQGLNWAIANVKITMLPAVEAAPPAIQAPAVAYVNSIPHTWVTANAWLKTMKMWKLQQDEAIADSGSESAVARFRDFKIFADTTHVDAGFNNNLKPFTLGPGTTGVAPPGGLQTGANVLDSEEWEYSQIVVPNIVADASGSLVDPHEYALHMVGVNLHTNVSRGIIDGYQESRAYPQSPDPVSPAIGGGGNWLRRMFDVGSDTSEIAENATDRNDELPYDQVNYPGSEGNMAQLETQGYVNNRSTTGVTTFHTGPFTAPCGLIRFDFAGQTGETTAGYYNIITVELVPGNHRGYLCETMEEF